MEKSYRTIQEYTDTVKKYFSTSGKAKEEVDAYFEEPETKELIRDAYQNRDMSEADPKALAYCLDMLY